MLLRSKEALNDPEDEILESENNKAVVANILACATYAYLRLYHYTEALQCTNSALAEAPDHAPSLMLRALVRFLNKDCREPQQALSDIEEAIRLRPGREEYESLKRKIEAHLKTLENDRVRVARLLIDRSTKKIQLIKNREERGLSV